MNKGYTAVKDGQKERKQQKGKKFKMKSLNGNK